jgi:hypothetical protein
VVASLLVLLMTRAKALEIAYCAILGLATIQAIQPDLVAPLFATYGAVGIHAAWGVATTVDN